MCLHVIQLNDMADKLAPEVYDINDLRALQSQAEALLKNGGSRASECTSLTTDF